MIYTYISLSNKHIPGVGLLFATPTIAARRARSRSARAAWGEQQTKHILYVYVCVYIYIYIRIYIMYVRMYVM